ncbi:macro domain-containing protein [Devosia sp. A8/3-2]|nr:macro domain-containing protein [Devosia sp. A8/3-2]
MRILLIDRQPELVNAWIEAMPDCEAICGDILEHEVDAVVSPGNSFGFMDGGIDLAYSTKFGWEVQTRVQRAIRETFDGELLVGRALIVPTGDPDIPHVIAAPTMRVPMQIADPSAVRLATRAAVRAASRAGLETIAMPGMGTGAGLVKFSWAARMMAAGIADALGPKQFPKSFSVAQDDHFKTYPR